MRTMPSGWGVVPHLHTFAMIENNWCSPLLITTGFLHQIGSKFVPPPPIHEFDKGGQGMFAQLVNPWDTRPILDWSSSSKFYRHSAR